MKKLISGLAAVSVAVMSAFAFGMPAQAAPADVVSFPDYQFETCVGNQIPGWTNFPVAQPITQAQAATITSLSCTGVSSIEGAQYLTGLTDFSITNGTLTDVSPAAGLVNTNMVFSNNEITDFSSLMNVVGTIVEGSQNYSGVPALPALNGVFTQTLILRDAQGNAATLDPAIYGNKVSYDGTTISYNNNSGTQNYILIFTSPNSGSWTYTQEVSGDIAPTPQPVQYDITTQNVFPAPGKPVPTTIGEFYQTRLQVSSVFTSPDTSLITMQGPTVLKINGAVRAFGTTPDPMNPYAVVFNGNITPTDVEPIIGNACPLELAVLHQGEITTQQIMDLCAANPTTTNWMYGTYKYTVEYQYSINGGGFQAPKDFVYTVLLPITSDANYFPQAADPYCVINSYSKTGNDITVDFTLNSIATDIGADKTYAGPSMLLPTDAGGAYNADGTRALIAEGNTVQITDTTTGGILYSNSVQDFNTGSTFGNYAGTAEFPYAYTGTGGTSYIDPNDSTKRIFKGSTNWQQTFADDIIGSTTDRTVSIVVNAVVITGYIRTVGQTAWQPEFDGMATTCDFVIPGNAAPVPPTPEPTPTPTPEPTPTPIPGPLPDETKNGGVDNLPYIMFGGLLFIGLAGATLTFARKRKTN